MIEYQIFGYNTRIRIPYQEVYGYNTRISICFEDKSKLEIIGSENKEELKKKRK